MFLTLFYLQWNKHAPVFDFHERRGSNIRLSNCNTTVEKIDPMNWGSGVVVSRDAMIENILYEVRYYIIIFIITIIIIIQSINDVQNKGHSLRLRFLF